MYEAVWRSDGERVAVFYMSAANEAAVLAEAKLFLKEHPDFRRSTGHLTLSIRTLSSAEGLSRAGGFPGQQSDASFSQTIQRNAKTPSQQTPCSSLQWITRASGLRHADMRGKV